jgi:hypothetical protein
MKDTQDVITLSEGDVAEASKAEDAAQDQLDQRIKDRAGWDATLDALNAVHNAGIVLRCESKGRVARIVGVYLLEHGHGEVWRGLYPVLLATCDIWGGLEQYGPGDEVTFVQEAGWWRKDAAKDAAEVPA